MAAAAGVIESAGGDRNGVARISETVLLGDGGWNVRVSVPAGDAGQVRRELLTVFAGIAPVFLASALVVGLLLAQGISRPVRALAARADEISAERARPFSLIHHRDEVRRLTLSFDQMIDAVSQSERQRVAAERIGAWREVARTIAHEVKNPLSPIKLAVENLRRTREKAPGELDRSIEEETATILEEVESLRRLVDEFSLFARLPAPQVVRCDLRALVSQALALFAPRIEAEKIEMRIATGETAVWARVDPEQIGRALKNVITNALDALAPVTDRRLTMAVRQAIGTRRGGRVMFAEIDIQDSGVGFEPAALRRVFEPYFTTRAARGGTGLGMAITHRIVVEHGGSIHASGSPGRGSTITMRLPVDGPPGTGA